MNANETTLHSSHNILKVNNYKVHVQLYGLQHGALLRNEKQGIKGPILTIEKTI